MKERFKHTMTTNDTHPEAPSLLEIYQYIVEILQNTELNDENEKVGPKTVSGQSLWSDYEFIVRTDFDPDGHWDHLGIEELADKPTTTTTDTEGNYLVDIREGKNTIIVLADLPRATSESITTAIDRKRNEFIIELEERTIKRFPLDNVVATITDSTFKNGILEVHIQTSEEEDNE